MKVLFAIAFLLFAVSASADVYVQGYTRSDGTYVSPHYRSDPNSSQYDNFSTRGNINPYTGERGTITPSPSPFSQQQQYRTIY